VILILELDGAFFGITFRLCRVLTLSMLVLVFECLILIRKAFGNATQDAGLFCGSYGRVHKSEVSDHTLCAVLEFQQVCVVYVVPWRLVQYQQYTNFVLLFRYQWNAQGEPHAFLFCYESTVLEAIVSPAIGTDEMARFL